MSSPETRRRHSVLNDLFEAQKLAFGPVVFQAIVALRDLEILRLVADAGDQGVTAKELSKELGLSAYGVEVLLEVGDSAGVVRLRNGTYHITDVGYVIQHDEMTRINTDFVRDVFYRPAAHLMQSIQTGKPEGLKEFGSWDTIYPALTMLPGRATRSWFAFNHYYSDKAFPAALHLVFREDPQWILDIGGNTGKWAMQCTSYDPSVRVTIVDLPEQIAAAKANLSGYENKDRIDFRALDVLELHAAIPAGADAIWMSQFLDCFSEAQIITILRIAATAMAPHTALYILEILSDRQQFEAATYGVRNTSLYFACLANGYSRMYHSSDLRKCIESAGLAVAEEVDGVGISHSLWKCVLC